MTSIRERKLQRRNVTKSEREFIAYGSVRVTIKRKRTEFRRRVFAWTFNATHRDSREIE